MKQRLILLILLIIGLGAALQVEAEGNAPADLATQILEGEFSNESKETAYIKLKELMDLSVESIETGSNIDGIFLTDELIQRFGKDYSYSEDSLVYDLWVGVDTFILTAQLNNDRIQYFYGYFYPTFETVTISESSSDLALVNEFVEDPSSIVLDFEQVDANYEDYDWSFTNQEMTYIDGSIGLTYDWMSKKLIEVTIGYPNYGRAKIDLTESDVNELSQIDDLSIGSLIDEIGDSWTFTYDTLSQSQKIIWQDPLGPQISVDLTDSLMVNRIESKNLKESSNN